jgi:hypothetical protein
MVGAYLNAARWGEDELRRLFKLQGPEQSLTDWLPVWQDQNLSDAESEAAAAFGFNGKGDALFPFNRNAIEQLADRHLTQGGRLIFNPRRVINEILRSTLLMRQSFEAHGFPPADFQDLRPNANLASWIRQNHLSEPISRRLATLLAIWGGNPVDPAEIAHIPPAVFSTFNLPTPSDLANIAFIPKVSIPAIVTASTDAEGAAGASEAELPSGPGSAPEDPKIADLRVKLDAWADGTHLGQTDAREIRNALFEMLKDAIDWPSLRIRASELKANWINIPQARGNQPTGRQLFVCDNSRDEDGSIRVGLLGAVRFAAINGKRWAYPRADDDYVASAAIVDHLLAQLKPKLVEDAKSQASTIGRALITQSRIAGLAPPVRLAGSDAVFSGLFANPEPRESQAFEENWDKLRNNALGFIGAKPARDILQSELLARIACFQGDSGRTPFAIDIARLLEIVGTDAAGAEAIDGLPEEVRTFIRPIAENRLWTQLTQIIARLSAFRAQIGDFIDDDFDKAGFIADLREIVRLLAATGTTPTNLPMSMREFEQRLVEFQGSAIVDLVTKATTIIETDREQMQKLLNALGSIDLGLIDRTRSFLNHTTALVAAAEVSVAREEADRSQVDPDAVAKELIIMLSVIADQPSAVLEAAE